MSENYYSILNTKGHLDHEYFIGDITDVHHLRLMKLIISLRKYIFQVLRYLLVIEKLF